ncbi:hypothetical protein MLD38_036588 [Melastoma candidum]|uniref:Uncharacterized protein n=1 Tax=Melastoma candidum TaxID=119954 RepID=A0ACB9LKD6_9MYRT|nr:hypothetical protein MLD38_036588 [Melastoma candidum]
MDSRQRNHPNNLGSESSSTNEAASYQGRFTNASNRWRNSVYRSCRVGLPNMPDKSQRHSLRMRPHDTQKMRPRTVQLSSVPMPIITRIRLFG